MPLNQNGIGDGNRILPIGIVLLKPTSCFAAILVITCVLYALFVFVLPTVITPPAYQLKQWPQQMELLHIATLVNETTLLRENHGLCTACKTIVFIKTHKTGSTTLQTVINRFGFLNNLSFVFNRRSSRNGHFYFLPVTTGSPYQYFLPPLNVPVEDYKKYTDYDLLAVHVRYNRPAMDTFMKKGTKYITIIREPSAQWESAFEQFQFQEAFPNNLPGTMSDPGIPEEKWLETFLEKPSYYREKLRYLFYEDVMGRRWYYAQNSQMYDLGLDPDTGFYNETVINSTIKNLEQEFTLILLTEYFDESLLVLKNELCWEYEDIVYFPKNQREARRNVTEVVREKIRKWNHADTLLYRHFNKTLWRKVKEYGPTFEDDLSYFRDFNNHIFTECGDSKTVLSGNRRHKYKEFSPKKNASLFCQTVAEHKRTLFDRVYERQNPFKTIEEVES